jgi:hypothetical protein
VVQVFTQNVQVTAKKKKKKKNLCSLQNWITEPRGYIREFQEEGRD